MTHTYKCQIENVRADFEISDCPNMKDKENDTDMEYEHYECKVCGLCKKLDYEDMK